MHLETMPLRNLQPWNVLIWPADTEDGLEIHRSLREAKEVVLHGAAHAEESPATFHYSRLHILPATSNPDFSVELQNLIQTCRIDAIFPGDNGTQLWLAQQGSVINATALTSSLNAVEICRSHLRLNGKLASHLPIAIQTISANPIHTVDCFSQNKGLLSAQARIENRSAILQEAHPWADTIARHTELTGAWSFRAQRDNSGKLYLLDIIPRITADMALSHVAGPNFALLSLYDAAGYDLAVDVFPAQFQMEYITEPRFIYDQPIDALYMDLDGSLILRDKVNAKLLTIIFQCRNRGIPVTLLTRHPGDLDSTLKHYHLAGIFDHIIHVTDLKIPKAAHIKEKHAVLIDDSFQERHDTFTRIGIRCFDPAAALCLLDNRDGVIDG